MAASPPLKICCSLPKSWPAWRRIRGEPARILEDRLHGVRRLTPVFPRMVPNPVTDTKAGPIPARAVHGIDPQFAHQLREVLETPVEGFPDPVGEARRQGLLLVHLGRGFAVLPQAPVRKNFST